jgi:hypothetical protein
MTFGEPSALSWLLAVARWRAASTTAMFVMIPNLREQPDTKWQVRKSGAVRVAGPGWRDHVSVADGELLNRSEDGKPQEGIAL